MNDQPQDPDLQERIPSKPPRPARIRGIPVAAVFCGGFLGTAAREALTLAFPQDHPLPWVILVINVVGAFGLGLLLDALARSGPDVGLRQVARLMFGTGFMGGFTTYSSFALAGALATGSDSWVAGGLLAVGTVLLGILASWAGVAAASLLTHPKRAERGK